MFGSRDDALAVAQRIVDQVGADPGDDLLPALVRSLERGLRLDAIANDVAVPGGGWERAASAGGGTSHRDDVTLRQHGEVVGRLGLRTAVRQLDRAAVYPASRPTPDPLIRLANAVDGVVQEIKQIVRDLRPRPSISSASPAR